MTALSAQKLHRSFDKCVVVVVNNGK